MSTIDGPPHRVEASIGDLTVIFHYPYRSLCREYRSNLLVIIALVLVSQDDQRILWEGVSSLTKQELQVSPPPRTLPWST